MEKLGNNHIQLEPEQISEPNSQVSTPRSLAESSVGPTTPTDSFSSMSSKADALHPVAPHPDFSATIVDLRKSLEISTTAKAAAEKEAAKWNQALTQYTKEGRGRVSKLWARFRSEKKLGLSDNEVKAWDKSVDTTKTGHTAYLQERVEAAQKKVRDCVIEITGKEGEIEKNTRFMADLKIIYANHVANEVKDILDQNTDKAAQLEAREKELNRKLANLPADSTNSQVRQELDNARAAINSATAEIQATRKLFLLNGTIDLLTNKGPYFDEFDKHYNEAITELNQPSVYTGSLIAHEKNLLQEKLTALKQKHTEAIENQKAIVAAKDRAIMALSSEPAYRNFLQDSQIRKIISEYESKIQNFLDRKQIVSIDSEVTGLTRIMHIQLERELPLARARSRDGILSRLQNEGRLFIDELNAIASGSDEFLAQIGRGLAAAKARDVNFRAENLLQSLESPTGAENAGNWHTTNQGFIDHNPQYSANSQDSLLSLPVPGQKMFSIDQNRAKILKAFSEERQRQLQPQEVKIENKSRVIDETKADLSQLQAIDQFPKATLVDFSAERPQKIEAPILASQASESPEPTATEVTAVLLRQAEKLESPEIVARAQKLHAQAQIIESSAIANELDLLGEAGPAARLQILQERQKQVSQKLEAVDAVIEQLENSKQTFEKSLLDSARKLSNTLSYATNELEQTHRLAESYDEQINVISSYVGDAYRESYENAESSLNQTTYRGIGQSKLFEAEKMRLLERLRSKPPQKTEEPKPKIPVKIKIQDSAANTRQLGARKKVRIQV